MATKKRKQVSKKRKIQTRPGKPGARIAKRKPTAIELSSDSPIKLELIESPRMSPIIERASATELPVRTNQSGDLQGLETDDEEDFESVEELAEEGQDLEAELLEAIEKAPDPDQSEIKPRKVPNRTKPRKFADRNRF